MTTTDKTTEKFIAKVDKRGHDECWTWLGAKGLKGYGRFWNGKRLVLAHRQSWEIFFGPIPEGYMVLHKCNNPSCVNPYHLYTGNNCDNMLDASRAGTHNGRQKRKFNEEQIKKIQELLVHGESQSVIAQRFNVAQSTISLVSRFGYPSRIN